MDNPSFFNRILVPLFLIIACPPAAFLMWLICTHANGSIIEFVSLISNIGFHTIVTSSLKPVFFGTPTAWVVILSFMAFQLLLMRIVPGKAYQGPLTPNGHTPQYKDNGFVCFVITLICFYTATHVFHWFNASIVYDNFAGIIGALNLFSLIFCAVLYVKGRFAPSGPDNGCSGNLIFDYYWGTELYPRLFGWDIKQFTNCRFGMMGWPVIILSFASAQSQTYGLSNSMCVAVVLQLAYIAKFFWWESGYMKSIDIMHDRAGFYICWGCLVWVPAIYTSPILYLVNHPIQLSPLVTAGILAAGLFSITINYLADRQRQRVRSSNGDCLVWGKKPELIHTEYTTEQGEQKQSLLITSGWWGLARHFHYLPEIAAAFFWTVPALFYNALPYFYVVFLAILLIHRSYRDDQRCHAKYQQYWQQYCQLVPSRIIPGWRSSGCR